MSESSRGAGAPPADQPVDVVLSSAQLLGQGFTRYERFAVTLKFNDGAVTLKRDIIRQGRVVAVLPIDLARQRIICIRQFRLGAHLANGRGNLVEIVAGFVDPGETTAQAARRECVEEIGVAPVPLIELLSYFTSPGFSDELLTLFLGVVDCLAVPERAGAETEQEFTFPMVVPIDAALAALTVGTLHNGPLLVALQWLALNRARLDDIVRAGSAGS
jgi:ADP-ribose diphosphatase